MNYDALLTYLSETLRGGWNQFKQAVQGVQGQQEEHYAGQVARVFSVLAHAEFAWEPTAVWGICPPALVQTPQRTAATAILCGQRTPGLLATLRNGTSAMNIIYDEQSQQDGPCVIRLTTSSAETLHDLARQTGIAFVTNAAEQLAVCVPTLASLIEASNVCPLPVVPPIEYFDIHQLEWQPTDQVSGDGVYRYENFGPDYRFIHDSVCRKVTREVGIYAMLNRSFWEYNHETHTLAISPRLLPPPLYQRALMLCSGFLAHYDGGKHRWIYRDIPPAIAYLLATKLQQPLEG